jgi:UDP-N-acetyl-D-mannosaminuronic acid dehydrogenase
MLINEGLPLYLVKKLEEKYDLASLNIGILGASFKAESDDTRSSLAYKLRKILLFKAQSVYISDPYVRTDPNIVSLASIVKDSDILIIATPHNLYKQIETTKPVIDIWNLLDSGNLI